MYPEAWAGVEVPTTRWAKGLDQVRDLLGPSVALIHPNSGCRAVRNLGHWIAVVGLSGLTPPLRLRTPATSSSSRRRICDISHSNTRSIIGRPSS